MKNEYRAKVAMLLKRARPRLAATHDLEFKNCFGSIAGYVNGQIFISCGKFGVALKLPQRIVVKLLKEKGVKHLQYFPNGHVKKDYAVIPRRIIENELLFKRLVTQSIKHALSSP